MLVLLCLQCLPYWPQASGKDVIVVAKVKGTSQVTGPFPINKAHTTLLKLENEVCMPLGCRRFDRAMVSSSRVLLW